MGKYEKDRKFYWLQLKEDFFDEDAISWLEEQENGEKYSLFYLKLCLKSLKTKGILIRQVGNMLVPYDRNKLAEITRTDPDTVTIAMKLLEQIGLIKIMENGEIYLTQIEALIGAKSIGAFKKEQQRLLKGRQEEDKCPPLCPPEIELEIELDIDIELELKKVVEFFNKNFYEIKKKKKNVFLSYIKSNFNSELIIYAMTLAIKQNKKTIAYVEGILEKWKEMKIDTVEKAKQAQEDYKKQREEKNGSNSYKNYDQRDCKNLDDFLVNKTWEENR